MGTDPYASREQPAAAILSDTGLNMQKACGAFDKKASLKPANEWLSVYAPRVRHRLAEHMPHLVKDLNDQDILAMQMASDISRAFSRIVTDGAAVRVRDHRNWRFSILPLVHR